MRHALFPAIWLFALLACCGGAPAGGPGSRPVLVTVAEASAEDIPIQLTAVGHVEATRAVSVRAQVTGQVLRLGFAEGAEVREGQLLVEIDPRPATAALHQAQAALARDAAQARAAAEELARYRPLAEQALVSGDQLSRLQAAADSTEATVQADRAAVERAQLELGYCKIAAPFAGVVGAALVDPGNVVRANDSALLTLHEVAPIRVAFEVPGRELARVRAVLAAGEVPVQARPSGDEGPAARGSLAFVDNAVDTRTGTIRLEASFPNADHRLWPGQFVSVSVDLAVELGALSVPAVALQAGQQGAFVYVVTDAGTAEVRPVEVGERTDARAVITSGLAAGEKVVTDGLLALAPGAQVTVRAPAEAAP
ncbi:MAG: efflux RND transporter periplasmic adaptor subunit [Pseudomonadota bacterium]